jgi:hypothetical protein
LRSCLGDRRRWRGKGGIQHDGQADTRLGQLNAHRLDSRLNIAAIEHFRL